MASFNRLANSAHCLRLNFNLPSASLSSAAALNARAPANPQSYATLRKSINASPALFGASSLAAVVYRGPSVLSRNFCSLTNFNLQQQQQQLQLLQQHQARKQPAGQRQQQQQQQRARQFSSLQIQLQPLQSTHLVQHTAIMAPPRNHRHICSTEITKNMTLYTGGPFQSAVDAKTLEFKKPTGSPLVLIMAWLMAKQKHLKKYAEIYTEMGFDVMVVHITPWQLLWPTKGTQIVAAETLKFLESNQSYAPIVVHGFSVGAYQFGEIMLQMSRDMSRYTQILDRIACQIWDSAADITEIPVGLPKSIFPKNYRMQTALRNYTLYHLKTFHNQATVHYMRSSQMFHSTLLKKPALFFVSDNDLIGPPSSNNAVRENWERADIKVTFKCWERSLHASHMIKHRDEYLDILYKHLESTGVLESIGLKTRAKL